MKKVLLCISLVACVITGFAGCNENETSKFDTACTGNYSVCLGEHSIMGCVNGRIMTSDCNDDQICTERNNQALCSNRTVSLCGNNILDEGEQCDSTQLDYQTCETVMPGTEGRLLCNAQCQFDVTNCVPAGTKCGNQTIDSGEQCDGQNLNGKTCGDIVSGTQGTLQCDSSCQFNTTGCIVPQQVKCGNQIVESGEQCDGPSLNNKTCGDIVQGTVGTLSCDASCNYVTDGCHVEKSTECGNGVLEDGEQCEGQNLNGKTCNDVVAGTEGILYCTSKCLFNTNYCYASNPQGKCGDGIIDSGEQCDGNNVNNRSCSDVIPNTQGTLSCNEQCQFVTSECKVPVTSVCGNNIVDSGEQCDGTNLNGATCGTIVSGTQGVLSCDNCRFNISQCKVPQADPVCGNNILEAGEQCDSTQFNGLTCKDIVSGTQGNLLCNNKCQIVTTNCKKPEPTCGNGILEDGEQCDGSNLDNKTCAQIIPESTGTLSCDQHCQYNTTNCKVMYPVEGSQCTPNLYSDVCYGDELYYCHPETSLVKKQSCKEDGMVCRTLPVNGDACVYEDTDHLCSFETEPMFFGDNSCEFYQKGLVIYAQCRRIDNQFYMVLSLANSVCAKDHDGSYLLSCNPTTGEPEYEICGSSCSTVQTETDTYGQCNNDNIPLVGTSCSIESHRICSDNHVLSCVNGKYEYLFTCTEDSPCDTITMNGYTWADCMSPCNSSLVGRVTSIDSTCTTDVDGEHFGIYFCVQTDSNQYRQMYYTEMLSVCSGNDTRYTCINGQVEEEACSGCSIVEETEENYGYAECGGM